MIAASAISAAKRTGNEGAFTLPDGTRAFLDHGVVKPLVPPSYMRPLEEELQTLLDLPNRFPGLVTSEIIGHSVEGRPIVALHITNFADSRPKPLVGIEGTIHGDEMGNAPFGMAAILHLLQDADQPGPRAILNSREIRIIPYHNPDGAAAVRRGYETGLKEDLFHRTNANGVDMNRNYPDNWDATSKNAGPHAASEPEVKAALAYWRAHPPNVFIAVHSAGKRVLIPDDASEEMKQFAAAIALRNGYTVQTSGSFTFGGTRGTSKDWAYHEFGIPSWTHETGSTHHMSEEELAESIVHNTRALSWAIRSADDPYLRALGPEVITASPVDARSGIEAVVVPRGLNHAVAGVEAFVDPFAPVGSGVPLRAAGVSDAETGATRWTLDPAKSAELAGRDGANLIYTRAVDDQGNWGVFTASGAQQL